MIILYILLAILIFGMLIFIHELGHFIAARACGVTVREFAIGMGPKIFSVCPGKKRAKKKEQQLLLDDAAVINEFTVDPRPPKPMEGSEPAETEEEAEQEEDVYTVYSLRAVPFGGFVSMAGENEDSDDPNAFHKKKPWQRMLILVAGAGMNLILGFVLMFVLVMNTSFATTICYYDHSGDKADTVYMSEGYLQTNDRILKIGNKRVHTGYDISYEIMYQGNQPLDITVERDGQVVVVEDVTFPTIEEGGSLFGVPDFNFYYSSPDTPLGTRISETFWRSCTTVRMVWESLGAMIGGRISVETVSGPIGVTEVIVEAARTDWLQLFFLVIVITINLGVMNLLPFPALDGGQLLICIVEAVIRRPFSEKVKGIINLVGLAILMILMVIIAFKDVFVLIGRLF